MKSTRKMLSVLLAVVIRMLERLNGIFAFALYDAERDEYSGLMHIRSERKNQS